MVTYSGQLQSSATDLPLQHSTRVEKVFLDLYREVIFKTAGRAECAHDCMVQTQALWCLLWRSTIITNNNKPTLQSCPAKMLSKGQGRAHEANPWTLYHKKNGTADTFCFIYCEISS